MVRDKYKPNAKVAKKKGEAFLVDPYVPNIQKVHVIVLLSCRFHGLARFKLDCSTTALIT